MDDGRSVHRVVCSGLAGLLRAEVGAYVRVVRERSTCTIWRWPAGAAIAACPPIVLRLPPAHPLVAYAGVRRSAPTCLSVAGRAVPRRSTLPHPSPAERPTAAAMDRRARAEGLRELATLLGCAEVADMLVVRDQDELGAIVVGRRECFRPLELELLVALHPALAALELHLRGADGQVTPGGREVDEDSSAVAAQHGLTPREVQVVRLLADGLMATSIAARIGVSPRTVHKHLQSLYAKLDTHDRLLAVNRARSLGLMPLAGRR
jgi:DNA-binding CsgD family transcriptional regulator